VLQTQVFPHNRATKKIGAEDLESLEATTPRVVNPTVVVAPTTQVIAV